MTKAAAAKFPKEVSAEELADFCGLTSRRVLQLVEDGKLPKATARGRYEFKPCLKALFAHFRELADGNPAQKSADVARQARADADRAELNLAKDMGLLMFVEDARRMWRSGLVQFREVIRHSKLTPAQKRDLTDKAEKIRVEGIDAKKGEE